MSSILNLKKDGNWITIPSLEGAQGEQGPNLITPETATTLTGLIKGTGSTVEAATPGADYLEYDDIAGRSDSGSNPVLEGVFPGTELAHCVLHGKSTQDGTPSPESPVDIVDYAPNELWVAGRNMIDAQKTVSGTYSGLTLTSNGDGKISRVGTASTEFPDLWIRGTYGAITDDTDVIMTLLPGETYYVADCALYSGTTSISDQVRHLAIKINPTTYPDGAPITSIRVARVVVGQDYDDVIFPRVYKGNLDYGWLPYQGHTYPLSDLILPGIPVDDGGNYTDESGQQYIADTYDVATGEYVQRVQEVVLDGTEAWTDAGSGTEGILRKGLMLNPAPLRPDRTNVPGPLICTHYENVSADETYYLDTGVALTPSSTMVAIYDPAYNTSGVSPWKAHLAELYAAGTPATILYALAEPIVSYRTPQQLPAPAPYTQVMAGGGHIAATLGNAMAPVKTTPQTLTVEQIKQVYVNLNIPVPTYEYSDRDLSKVFSADELHEKIAAQDYSGIRMGDYWPIPLSGTAHDYATDTDFTLNETLLLEFMPNFYAESGDTAVPPHILVCSRDLLSKTLQFRSADDVWYDTAATNPWLGSHLYQTLNNPDNGIVNLVRQTDIGQYLYAGPNGKGMRDVLETKAAGATTATGRGWADRGLLFLPHEREIWGSGPFGEKQDGGYCLQWPTFAGSRKRITKYRNGSRYSWWSCSSLAGSSTFICSVNGNGIANSATASGTWLSVPLCFLIT